MDKDKSSFNTRKEFKMMRGAGGAEILCVFSGALKNR